MVYTYTLTEQDFIDFQLYTASQSTVIRQRKIRQMILLTFIFAVLALLSYLKGQTASTTGFGFAALATVVFYPTYYKYMHKRHYTKHVREHYQTRTSHPVSIEVTPELLIAKDKTGEGRLLLSEVSHVNETKHHLFIQLSSNTTLIVPRRIPNAAELKAELQQLGIRFHEDLHWDW